MNFRIFIVGISTVLAVASPPLGQVVFSVLTIWFARSLVLRLIGVIMLGTGAGFLATSFFFPLPKIQQCKSQMKMVQTGNFTHLNGPSSNSCIKPGIFKYSFTIGANGTRLHSTAGGKAKVFMAGCSFTFGMGVEDDETLAALMEKLGEGRYTTRNYGTNGGGLNQVLGLVSDGLTEHEQEPVLIYTFLHDHIHRFSQRGYWRVRMAALRMQKMEIRGGELRVDSNEFLRAGLRFLSWKTGLRLEIPIAQLHADMERDVASDSEINEFKNALEWAAERFFQRHPRGRFVVVYWPLHNEPKNFRMIWRALEFDSRIERVELPDRLPLLGGEIGRPDHPKPAAYRMVARILLDHLQAKKSQ